MKSFLLSCIIVATFVTMSFGQDQPGIGKNVKAPDFEATNYKGENVRLSQLYSNGPVVLIFYRGG